MAVNQVYQARHYPGARPIPDQFNYTLQLDTVLLEQSYLTPASLAAVQDWYEDRLDLVTALVTAEETGHCVLLRGGQVQLRIEQATSVSICQTPNGQLIRITSLVSVR